MAEEKKNPYAGNKAGEHKGTNKQTSDTVKVAKVTGKDLRCGK